jgi:hypothetical protein
LPKKFLMEKKSPRRRAAPAAAPRARTRHCLAPAPSVRERETGMLVIAPFGPLRPCQASRTLPPLSSR